MVEKIDIPYSSLYKLQLAFASLDNSSSVDDDLKAMSVDDASENALKWLYEHKKPSLVSSDSESVDLDSLDLQSETASLYNDVKNLRLEGGSMDVREMLAVSKLQAELLTRVLDLHERSKRNRQIGEFVEYVFNLLTEEQKDKVLKDFDGTYK